MKVGASVRKICEKCRLFRRRGRIIVICKGPPQNRHGKIKKIQWKKCGVIKETSIHPQVLTQLVKCRNC